LQQALARFGRREGSQRSPHAVFETAELPQKRFENSHACETLFRK
jgi:hypothetical protein